MVVIKRSYIPLLAAMQSGYEFIFFKSDSYLSFGTQLGHTLVFAQASRHVCNSRTSGQTGREFSLK